MVQDMKTCRKAEGVTSVILNHRSGRKLVFTVTFRPPLFLLPTEQKARWTPESV